MPALACSHRPVTTSPLTARTFAVRAAWFALGAALASALAGCAAPAPAPLPPDPGPYPHEHSGLFAAYLKEALHDPATARVTLAAAPLRYTRMASPPHAGVDGWAACYGVDAKLPKSGYTGARTYLAIFQGGGLYDVLVDEPRSATWARTEVRRWCPALQSAASTLAPRARGPIAIGADGRPAIPGVLTPAADAPTRAGDAAPPTGQFAYQAEQAARRLSCAAPKGAVLVGKGPGVETYALRCDDGRNLTLRCDFGNCRPAS